MNWLNTPLLFKPILDPGVLFVTVLLMITVGMELEGRHFRQVAQRKFALYRRWWARASDATKAPAVSELHP